MNGKKIAFWTWVLVVIVGAVWLGISSTSEDIYKGTKIEFNTSRDLQIDAETVTFEAASEDFFVLRKESGETIVGIPTARPLGWSHDKYYVATSQEVSGGKWLFQDGSATVKITSEKAVTVRLVVRSSTRELLGIMFVALLIWLFGLLWYFIIVSD
jgi:hypothetical protein